MKKLGLFNSNENEMKFYNVNSNFEDLFRVLSSLITEMTNI